jgi:hypothetical protein
VLNGKVAVMGHYPDRGELAKLLKLKAKPASAPASSGGCCCEGTC